MNLRKIVAFSQIGLATRFPTPSVHAMLPDLDGRTHAPSVGADVEKFRASAKRFDRKACSKMDLRSDEERRGATRAEEQWTAQQVRRCRPPRWLPRVRAPSCCYSWPHPPVSAFKLHPCSHVVKGAARVLAATRRSELWSKM